MPSVYKPHELKEFQEFMLSSERVRLVNDQVYQNFSAYIKPQENILDFGCGQGYVSLLCATTLAEKNIDAHVYACDYQELLLDLFWKHIVQKKLTKVTPFFVPNHNRIIFPTWLPSVSHVIFSFSLSAVKDIPSVFHSLQSIVTDTAKIHVIDWNPECKDSSLEEFVPTAYRVDKQKILQALTEHGYEIEKQYAFTQKTDSQKPPFYGFTVTKS